MTEIPAEAVTDATLTDPPPQTMREIAERILLVAEIGTGMRCPRCHGIPASRRWPSGRVQTYRCGCGHRWTPFTAYPIRYQLSIHQIVETLAEGGPMPPVPAKVGCAQCTNGDAHV